MTGFLAELGTKLADRWLAMLLLPGLLFAGVVAMAGTLGQRHALDTHLVAQRLTDLTTVGPGQDGLARTAVLLVVLLLVATGSALAAQALGRAAEQVFSGRWPLRRLVERRTRRRHAEWRRLDEEYRAGDDHAAVARNRIALAPPVYPTWTGDRLYAPVVRVHNDYGLDLVAAWPRLWLLLPDTTRAPLTESRQRFDQTMALAGWAVLYLVVALFWWPSVLVAVCVTLVSWRRGRTTADVYAELVESAVDVHLTDLLECLDDAARPISPQRGRAVNQRIRKGT